MKLRHRRGPEPDPLCEVRQATAELEQLLLGVGSQLDAVASDLGVFAAGVNDTAGRLRAMADEAERNARNSDA